VLAGVDDPVLARDLLEAASLDSEADYIAEVRASARAVLEDASAEDWKKALEASTTRPLVSLAITLSETSGAMDPAGLQDALHDHFHALADSKDVWKPDEDSFLALTRLLGPEARSVLASQFGAELEGRDGQVGADLFPTYGAFLASEETFRTHSKLPNAIERFIAHGAWDVVDWFAQLAEKREDTVGDKNRRGELSHLGRYVQRKLVEEDPAPEALTRLASVLKVDIPAAETKVDAPETEEEKAE
jgi:hypothetical protein